MELLVDIKKKLSGFKLDIKFNAELEAVGLLGASGSGKSMTLRCIAGLEKPDKGRIVLNGRTLFDSEKGINVPCGKRKVGFLFQNYALFPNMTVSQNIGFALDHLNKNDRNQKVSEMIKMMQMESLEERYPFQLSGGQQQRVALARALAIEPELLLLDEPFSALDEHLRGQMVKQLIETLSNYHGVTLFVTHNRDEAYTICQKLLILANGNVEARGDRKQLFKAPPTLITAQITGCKNLSAARYVSEYELEALDWGVRLKTVSPVTAGLKYVGIRAHYLKLATAGCSENVFKCWLKFVNEQPFRMFVYLSIGETPSGTQDYDLLWDISKEKWEELRECPQPWNISLCAESIITLNK